MRRLVRAPALIVVGFMLLQAAWILTMPPFRGIDEFDHAYRAAAVAGGQWVANDSAEDGRGQLVVVPRSIVDAAHAQCTALDYTGPDNCSPVTDLPNGKVEVASAASSYYPPFYWAIGSAALPFEGAAALYAMRTATALLSLMLISVAVWALAKLPGTWPLVGLVVAITPVFLYSTTVAAPNGVEMSAGLALWCTLLALVRQGRAATETKLLWAGVLSAAVLGGLRLLGPLFILMIVTTVVLLDWGVVRTLIRRRIRAIAAGCVLVVASIVGQLWWALDSVAEEVRGEASNPTTFNSVNIIVWPLQTIAAFPLRNQAGAPVVYPVFLLLLAGLLVMAWLRGDARARVVTFAALGSTLCFPFVFTVATLSSVGNIWQGRYLLPYAVGFVLLAGLTAGRGPGASGPSLRILVPAAVLYGVAMAACLVKIRNDELATNPASIADAAWHAPSPLLLVALVAAAVAALVLGLVQRRAEQVDVVVPKSASQPSVMRDG